MGTKNVPIPSLHALFCPHVHYYRGYTAEFVHVNVTYLTSSPCQLSSKIRQLIRMNKATFDLGKNGTIFQHIR